MKKAQIKQISRGKHKGEFRFLYLPLMGRLLQIATQNPIHKNIRV